MPRRRQRRRALSRARPARHLQPERRPRWMRRSRAMWCSAGWRARPLPEVIVNVVDATNLRLGLRLSLELKRLGRADDRRAEHERHRAQARHERGSARARCASSACPVVETVAVQPRRRARAAGRGARCRAAMPRRVTRRECARPRAEESRHTQREVRRILAAMGYTRAAARPRAGAHRRTA